MKWPGQSTPATSLTLAAGRSLASELAILLPVRGMPRSGSRSVLRAVPRGHQTQIVANPFVSPLLGCPWGSPCARPLQTCANSHAQPSCAALSRVGGQGGPAGPSLAQCRGSPAWRRTLRWLGSPPSPITATRVWCRGSVRPPSVPAGNPSRAPNPLYARIGEHAHTVASDGEVGSRCPRHFARRDTAVASGWRTLGVTTHRPEPLSFSAVDNWI